MRFTDKLFTDIFLIVVDYKAIYKLYHAINKEGELLIIASVQYRGKDSPVLIDIIGSKK